MEQETKLKDEASQKGAVKRNRLETILKGTLASVSVLGAAAIIGWTGYCIGALKAEHAVGRSSVTLGMGEDAENQQTNLAVSEKFVSIYLERGNSEGGSTRLAVYRSLDSSYADDEVFIFRPNGQSVFYEDNDFYGVHDGLVDTIFFPNGENSIQLIRDSDYANNQSLFDEADKVLKETKERFSQSVGIEVH
ncbi:MAG: hypothetical protein V1734_05070 [Nanoarchaeota archaeon]